MLDNQPISLRNLGTGQQTPLSTETSVTTSNIYLTKQKSKVQQNTLIKDNMKTAVEWLVEELTRQNMFMHLFAKEIEQAKEMEKQQIIDAYQTSHISMMTAEQYYKETYKNKEQ